MRVQVYCRVRATDGSTTAPLQMLQDRVQVHMVRSARNNNNNSRHATAASNGARDVDAVTQSYKFDAVFSGAAATQEAVYTTAVAHMIDAGVLGGVNASVLCYGAHHTGKSYTLFGGNEYASRGIAPRALQQLYNGVAEHASERVYEVALTFVLLAGEQLIDLLAVHDGSGNNSNSSSSSGGVGEGDATRNDSRPAVSLDKHGDVHLRNVTRRVCVDEAAALSALFEGVQAARAHSHRAAHVVLTVYVQYQSVGDSSSDVHYATLQLVDLASPQRVQDVRGGREQRMEAQAVNRSLSTLEQVVAALAGGGDGSDSRYRGTTNDDDDADDDGNRSDDEDDGGGGGRRRRFAGATVAQAAYGSSGSGNNNSGGGGYASVSSSPRRERHRPHGGMSPSATALLQQQQQQQQHVPYRQSKLTMLLKGSLGGRCLTAFIAHITPTAACTEATLTTLNVARRMSRVTVEPVVNVCVNTAAHIRALERQVADLKAELRLQGQLQSSNQHVAAALSAAAAAAAASMGGGGGGGASAASRAYRPGSVLPGSNSNNNNSTATSAAVAAAAAAAASSRVMTLGVDELQQLYARVQAYMDGSAATVPLRDIREMHAAFAYTRVLLEQRDGQIAELRSSLATATAAGSGSAHGAAVQGASASNNSNSSSAGRSGAATRSSSSNNNVSGSTATPVQFVRKSSYERRHNAGGGSNSNGSHAANDTASAAVVASGATTVMSERGDVFAPSVLDRTSGVSYGTSTRPATVIAALSSSPPAAAAVAAQASAEARVTRTHAGAAALSNVTLLSTQQQQQQQRRATLDATTHAPTMLPLLGASNSNAAASHISSSGGGSNATTAAAAGVRADGELYNSGSGAAAAGTTATAAVAVAARRGSRAEARSTHMDKTTVADVRAAAAATTRSGGVGSDNSSPSRQATPPSRPHSSTCHDEDDEDTVCNAMATTAAAAADKQRSRNSNNNSPQDVLAQTALQLQERMRSASEQATRRAFEDYKHTPTGALQVRTLNALQQQLRDKTAAIAHMQQRLLVVGSVVPLSGGGLSPLTRAATADAAVHLTRAPASATVSPMATLRVAGDNSSCNSSSSDDVGGGVVEQLCASTTSRQTAMQATACAMSLQRSLHEACAERDSLLAQVEQRRAAFFDNFRVWCRAVYGEGGGGGGGVDVVGGTDRGVVRVVGGGGGVVVDDRNLRSSNNNSNWRAATYSAGAALPLVARTTNAAAATAAAPRAATADAGGRAASTQHRLIVAGHGARTDMPMTGIVAAAAAAGGEWATSNGSGSHGTAASVHMLDAVQQPPSRGRGSDASSAAFFAARKRVESRASALRSPSAAVATLR